MQYKNKKLPTSYRPTSSHIIKALGNLLDFKDKLVIDLYAGSGRFGKLAIQKSAFYTVFVEKDYKLVSILKKNLKDNPNCRVIKEDVFSFLRKPLIKIPSPVNIIFADPPFKDIAGKDLLSGLETSCLVENGTMFVLQQFHKTIEASHPYWEVIDNRRYGEQRILFYKCIIQTK